MIKRAAAVTAALGTLCAGVVAVAPNASADTWVQSCRSWNTKDGKWATEPYGVTLDSCFGANDTDPGNVEAQIGYTTSGQSIDACAQLVNIATGAWAKNYGCIGWSGANQGQTYSQWLTTWTDVAAGTYVVQVGFWAYDASGQLQYLGNVQSPKATV